MRNPIIFLPIIFKKIIMKTVLKSIGGFLLSAIPGVLYYKTNKAAPHLATPENPSAGIGVLDWPKFILYLMVCAGWAMLIFSIIKKTLTFEQAKEIASWINPVVSLFVK